VNAKSLDSPAAGGRRGTLLEGYDEAAKSSLGARCRRRSPASGCSPRVLTVVSNRALQPTRGAGARGAGSNRYLRRSRLSA
jgi:hypothetical protein